MRELIYSMGVSLDGFIAGPGGEIDWSAPDAELHRFHNEQAREIGVHLCGRRLYETMLPWETVGTERPDPVMAAEGPDPVMADEGPDPVMADEGPDPVMADEGPDPVMAAEGPDPVMAPEGPDPVMADEGPDPVLAEFASIWQAILKVVFSATLQRVEGNARLARRSPADEVADLRRAPEDGEAADDVRRAGCVAVGGAGLAGEFARLDLIDEYRLFVSPVVLGGGRPYFPAMSQPLELELLQTRTFGSGVLYLRYRRVRGRAV